MHKFIRETVAAADQSAADSLKILYGGSVNPQNAVQLLNQKEIDGALVGRCSLDAEQFIKICQGYVNIDIYVKKTITKNI